MRAKTCFHVLKGYTTKIFSKVAIEVRFKTPMKHNYKLYTCHLKHA